MKNPKDTLTNMGILGSIANDMDENCILDPIERDKILTELYEIIPKLLNNIEEASDFYILMASKQIKNAFVGIELSRIKQGKRPFFNLGVTPNLVQTPTDKENNHD